MINLLSAYGNTQSTIKSVSIHGAVNISDKLLLESIVSKPGFYFSYQQLSQDLITITNRYYSEGYYFAEVHVDSLVYSSDSANVDIEIGICENTKMSIGKINLIGNSVLANNDIYDLIDSHVGGYFIPTILESDIEKILKKYDQIGYPFAKIEISKISTFSINDSTDIIIDLSINECPKITVDEIKVSGNTFTKSNVIIRETRLKLHELFNDDEVEKVSTRLMRLNIFSNVEEPKLYSTTNGSGLLIKVEEGNTNSFDGIIGYAPGTSSVDKGILSGMVDVSMRNLFGTGRKFYVKWLRDARSSQEVDLRYEEPWLMELPLYATIGFNQRQQDSIYVRRSYNLKVGLLLTESFSIGGTIYQEDVIPSGETTLLSKSNSTSVGIDIGYDTRNNLISPTQGIHYFTEYRVGNKKIQDQKSAIQRLSLDAEFFLTTFKHQVIAIGVHGRSITGDALAISDFYRFGGTNTLRGYRENQFVGSRVAWTNTEYRFLLSGKSFFYGLFDTGYYFLPADDSKNISSTQSFKYGYGIGIRLETAIGNVGVGLAFGEGDSFLQGKIHFGLINEF